MAGAHRARHKLQAVGKQLFTLSRRKRAAALPDHVQDRQRARRAAPEDRKSGAVGREAKSSRWPKPPPPRANSCLPAVACSTSSRPARSSPAACSGVGSGTQGIWWPAGHSFPPVVDERTATGARGRLFAALVSIVTRVHGLQHVERFLATDFADHNAVRPHTGCSPASSRCRTAPFPSRLGGRVSRRATCGCLS